MVLIKINGAPLSPAPVTTNGIDIKYDLADTLHDAYHMVHTPLNLDISYNGHNVIQGDVNLFNWGERGISQICDGVGYVINHLF